MTGDEMLKTMADELDRLLSPSHIMGSAIDLGDKVVIPVAEFGFGFGAGQGPHKEGGGGGAGAGGGGGISPVALVIVHKDVRGVEGIQVLSLRKDNPVAQVISALSESLAPRVIEALKAMDAKRKPEKKSEEAQ